MAESESFMKIAILSGNPKTAGLCQSVTDEMIQGIKDAGSEFLEIRMDSFKRCNVCGGGWGICQKSHKCAFGEDDGFNVAQESIAQTDAVIIISPVYWHEISEGLKSFLDRLRRCNFRFSSEKSNYQGIFTNKLVILVASPGGSGRGAVTCLGQLERFCEHVGARVFDYIMVNRWNADYKRKTAYEAAFALASGQKPEAPAKRLSN